MSLACKCVHTIASISEYALLCHPPAVLRVVTALARLRHSARLARVAFTSKHTCVCVLASLCASTSLCVCVLALPHAHALVFITHASFYNLSYFYHKELLHEILYVQVEVWCDGDNVAEFGFKCAQALGMAPYVPIPLFPL